MAMTAKPIVASIGLRVKTGRATAVLLAGPLRAPRVLEKRAVELWDPAVPASRQPYHLGLELPEGENAPAVVEACAAARAVAAGVVRRLIDDLRRADHDPRGVGLVVSSDSDGETLTNPHVRAHALEGRLFREILEAGVAASGLPCLVLVEREAYDRAAPALKQSAADLKRAVAALGAGLPRPWAAEEKTAALAAWVALLSR
jgi:hypothetical protein